VVARWDRLARNTTLDGYLRYTLQHHKVAVLSATEMNGADDVSKLTESILAAVAQFEHSLIVARLVAGRKAKAKAGGYACGAPRFGKMAQGKALVSNAREAEIVAEMQRLRRKRKTYREIASALDAAGMEPRRGGAWQVSSVYNTLQRSRVH